jgi:hypothetical protein
MLTTVVAVLGWLASAPAAAQIEAYRFEASKVPVGKVFHFRKSQLDGTHETQISVYIAAEDRIEALKWDRDGSEATLVQAQMDWKKFSVQRFDAWHLAKEAAPELRATLDVQGDALRMSLMEQPLTLTHWPWHSFDFDFTGLNFTLPHLREPGRELVFWRTDFVYTNPPKVAELGEMRLRFERSEKHAGKKARRYSISGAGIQGAMGTWWSDPRTGLLVEYEIPVGDEPGYDNVRLKLLRTQRMSVKRWEEFKRAAVGTR